MVPPGLKQIQPDAHVCILQAGIKMNHITFTKQGRQIAGYLSMSETIRSNQHVGQPGMHRQEGHLPTVISNPEIRIKSAERLEKPAGAVKSPLGWRIWPLQLGGIVHPPERQFQDQVGQVGRQYFGSLRRNERGVHFPGPQTQT